MGWLKTFLKGMATDKSSAYEKKESIPIEVKPVITFKDDPPPLENLLKDAVPSQQGLYPHEILMLHYAPRYKTSGNNFQSFWYWDYSVADPQSILNSLAEKGFLSVGGIELTLEDLKLPQIKEELKSIGQKVTGKKADLIDRLIQNGDLDKLSQKYPDRHYILTAKGEQELKENKYVPYLHNHGYMSIWEMNRKLADSKLSFRDILWGDFNRRSVIHFQNYDFGLYRNIRLSMYHFLMEENRTETAFRMLCEVLLYDLNALDSTSRSFFDCETKDPKSFFQEYYPIILERFFPYRENDLNIPPAVLNWLAKMQSSLNLSDEEYRKALLDEFQEISLIRRIFTNEECADIVIARIHQDHDALKKIYKNAESRERAKIAAYQ